MINWEKTKQMLVMNKDIPTSINYSLRCYVAQYFKSIRVRYEHIKSIQVWQLKIDKTVSYYVITIEFIVCNIMGVTSGITGTTRSIII